MIRLYEHTSDGALNAVWTDGDVVKLYRNVQMLAYLSIWCFDSFCVAARNGVLSPDDTLEPELFHGAFDDDPSWGLVATHTKEHGVDVFSADILPGRAAIRFIGPLAWTAAKPYSMFGVV